MKVWALLQGRDKPQGDAEDADPREPAPALVVRSCSAPAGPALHFPARARGSRGPFAPRQDFCHAGEKAKSIQGKWRQ